MGTRTSSGVEPKRIKEAQAESPEAKLDLECRVESRHGMCPSCCQKNQLIHISNGSCSITKCHISAAATNESLPNYFFRK